MGTERNGLWLPEHATGTAKVGCLKKQEYTVQAEAEAQSGLTDRHTRRSSTPAPRDPDTSVTPRASSTWTGLTPSPMVAVFISWVFGHPRDLSGPIIKENKERRAGRMEPQNGPVPTDCANFGFCSQCCLNGGLLFLPTVFCFRRFYASPPPSRPPRVHK
jgi:hypothetical protein